MFKITYKKAFTIGETTFIYPFSFTFNTIEKALSAAIVAQGSNAIDLRMEAV